LNTPNDLARQLDQALQGPGTLHLAHPEVNVEAEIEALDTLGVRLRKLRMSPRSPGQLEESARQLQETVRPNGERLGIVELDPRLGGARLRTNLVDIRNSRFFQLDLDISGQVELQRIQVEPNSGDRCVGHFDLSREAFGRLAEDILDACRAPEIP
jgi:hypothetical protein